MLDDLMSLSQVARILEVDPSLLVRRAQREQSPAQKVGGVWVTTLRQVVEADGRRTRGKRGPAPRPLPGCLSQLLEDAISPLGGNVPRDVPARGHGAKHA